MTREQEISGNILCAEFMGFKKHESGMYEALDEIYFIPTEIKNGEVLSYGYVFPVEDLQFHSSIEWIVSVVHAIIREIGIKTIDECTDFEWKLYGMVYNMKMSIPIPLAFEICVEYINFTNKKKNK